MSRLPGTDRSTSWAPALFAAAALVFVADAPSRGREVVHPGEAAASGNGDVLVTPNEAERRVDVTVGGHPFTAYIWPERLKKPVLFPLRTATGTPVTRGFPLEPRPGERVDHPHQVGFWFNYGDVNGVDFWNNSDAINAEDRGRMGTVLHRSVDATRSGPDTGELEVTMDWVMPDGSVVLQERTRFVFAGGADWRRVDRITTLQARQTRVVLADNKEGVLGLRVARGLEEPSDTPEVFTDASGRATTVPVLDNTGVDGVYLSSEGHRGGAVWGTRGRWVTLSGRPGGEPVTLAILDHPRNPGFPTYWHARGYGLFAANPLGQHVFSEGREALNLTLEPHQETTFRYRLLILSEIASAERVEEAWKEFSATFR